MEKQKSHKRELHKTISWCLAETFQVKREWHDIFKVLKGENETKTMKKKILPRKIIIQNWRRDKQKLNESTTTKPALQEMLKWLL